MKATREFGHIDQIWFLYQVPRRSKPEKLMLNVGQQRGNRLSQAQLGAGAATDQGYKVLQAISRELKRRTTAGVWVIGANGYAGYTKDDRISEGAKDAERSGELDLTGPHYAQTFHADCPESSP